MNQTAALARNTALQIVGKLLATILGVVTVAILTRYLGKDGYGQFTIAVSFLSIFAVIVDFGLTLTTTQMISQKQADEKKLLANLLSLRILSAIVFLALAPLCALLFPYDQIVITAIAIGAGSFLFGSTAQMLIGVFQKRLLISRAIIAELANRALVLIGVALAPVLGLSLLGVMWILLAGNFVQLLLMLGLSRQLVKFGLEIDLAVWKKIIGLSWPIGASIFFNLIYLRGDVVFLSLFRSDAEVGVYGAAYKVVDVVASIPVMYMGLALPLLVAAWSAGKKHVFHKHMQLSFDFMMLLAIPITFGSIAIGVPLMQLIAGADYAESGQVLAILGPASAIVFMGSLFGHAIVGVEKQRVMTWGYAFVAAITIAGYLLFIPEHGMWAAAWMTLISEILITLLTAAVVMRVSKFIPRFTMTARALLASIVMFICLTLLPDMNAVWLLLIGIGVYAIALSALGGPKPKQIVHLFLPEKPPILP